MQNLQLHNFQTGRDKIAEALGLACDTKKKGPESTLLKHLGIYVNLEENEGVQLKTKILVSVDYIHQRFFNKWDYIRVPNQAWGEEKSSHQENNSEVDRVKKCVDLFLTFCEHLHQNALGTLKGTSLDIAHKVSPPMLTPQMLDSVLDSSVLPDIADLIQSYQQIPQTLLWRGTTSSSKQYAAFNE
ncbi:unnamed protein product [Bemisia tabaci]|uniref:Uncharacterized protein n=1 Tax=Bemisia tabaci TaxID=7038 RepID=A0A9P0APQ5_BEMTA|nr:unnamed protein product [Bemisia tabaci]